MKFLIVVLGIHFAVEVISKRKNKAGNEPVKTKDVRHPAEFNLR